MAGLSKQKRTSGCWVRRETVTPSVVVPGCIASSQLGCCSSSSKIETRNQKSKERWWKRRQESQRAPRASSLPPPLPSLQTSCKTDPPPGSFALMLMWSSSSSANRCCQICILWKCSANCARSGELGVGRSLLHHYHHCCISIPDLLGPHLLKNVQNLPPASRTLHPKGSAAAVLSLQNKNKTLHLDCRESLRVCLAGKAGWSATVFCSALTCNQGRALQCVPRGRAKC